MPVYIVHFDQRIYRCKPQTDPFRAATQVMASNGVSHLIAADELLALQQTFEWLMFVPTHRGQLPPVLHHPIPSEVLDRRCPQGDFVLVPTRAGLQEEPSHAPFDPVDRVVEYTPSRDRPNDDPRWMFTGVSGKCCCVCVHLKVIDSWDGC